MLIAMIAALSHASAQDDAGASLQASAVLEARSGSRTTGLVTFLQGGEPGAATPGTPTPGTGTPGSGSTSGTPGTGTPGAGTGTERPGEPGTGAPGTPGVDRPPLGDRMPMGDQMGRAGDAGGNDKMGEHMDQMGEHMGMKTPASGAMGMAAPVQVSIRLVNATPGNHAVFLHENGDCSAPDASSAGNYYAGVATKAPGGAMRPGSIGAPATPEQGTTGTPGTGTPGTGGNLAGPPAGYLGFVTVGAEGRGEKDLTLTGYTLAQGQSGSLLDRSVVVYEKAPDFTAGGDPGARQACGVIRARSGAPLGTE